MAGVIQFYDQDAPYYEFTNFWETPGTVITIDGKQWRTSEHYFQASKFISYPDVAEMVRLAHSPREAFNLSRDRKYAAFIRKDWDEVKNKVMRKALLCKFSQIAALVKTGTAELVEHTKNDNYWGDGGDGSGKNMLGKLLMEVRSELNGTQLFQ